MSMQERLVQQVQLSDKLALCDLSTKPIPLTVRPVTSKGSGSRSSSGTW